MFRSSRETETAWFFYETLTLLHPYVETQKLIVESYLPFDYIVDRYSDMTGRKVHSVTKNYLSKYPSVSEQNVALLKNAMELWRAASRTSEAVAPMLYHYSWHCFNAFLVYSFFRWEPQHTRSHGIQIKKWSDNIEDIEVKFLDRGLFKRLIDTWTLLGASLAFSPVLPVYEDIEKLEKIAFVPNRFYILKDTNRLSVKQLLFYDSDKFQKDLYGSNLKERIVSCPFMINSISLPTNALKNYLIVFVASSMARYRPNLWSSALIGRTEEESDLALLSGRATVDYTAGIKPTTGYLYQVSRVLREVVNGRMKFKWT